MKKKNSRCEFASERSELLRRSYRESLARQSKISIAKAFQDAVEAPAPRFWVSEARAMRIIKMMLKGEKVLDGMHSKKQQMYEEIFRRVKVMMEEHPEMPLGDVVFEVVNSPAPESYITGFYAAKVVKAHQSVQGVVRIKK